MSPLRARDPQRLGRHQLVGRLGSGGMGVVYLADGPLGPLALKVVRDELASDSEFRTRFQREVQASFRVSGPWTAKLVDFDTTADPPWLATEFIDAPDLQEVIDSQGPMAPGQQRDTALALAEGLAQLHAAGLVHRDLKPSNVLLPASGPKIIDFGIAAVREDIGQLTATSSVLGSPAWMAPEQILRAQTGTASDVYSWGAVIAFCGTGRPLVAGNSLHQVMANAYSPTTPDLHNLDPSLREVVAAALAPDPLDRPSSEQLVTRLGKDRTRPVPVTPDVPAPPMPAPPPLGPTRQGHRNKALLIGAGMLLLAVVAVAAVVLATGSKKARTSAAATPSPRTAGRVTPSARVTPSSGPTSSAGGANPTGGAAATSFPATTSYADLIAKLPNAIRVTCNEGDKNADQIAAAYCRVGDQAQVVYTGFRSAADQDAEFNFGDHVANGCQSGPAAFIAAKRDGGYLSSYTDGTHAGLLQCYYYASQTPYSNIKWTDKGLGITGFIYTDDGKEASYLALYQRWLKIRHFGQ